MDYEGKMLFQRSCGGNLDVTEATNKFVLMQYFCLYFNYLSQNSTYYKVLTLKEGQF